MSHLATLENRRLLAVVLKEECMREVEEEEDEVRMVFMDGMEVYMHKALLCLLSPFLRELLPDMACPTLLLPEHGKESMRLLLSLLKQQGNSGDETLVPSSLASLVFDMGLNVPLGESAGDELAVVEEHVTLVEENVVSIARRECERGRPSKKLRMAEREVSGNSDLKVKVVLKRLKLSKTKADESFSITRTEPDMAPGRHLQHAETIPEDSKMVETVSATEKGLSKENSLKMHGFAVRGVSVRLPRLRTALVREKLMKLPPMQCNAMEGLTVKTKETGTKARESNVSCVDQLENITHWINHHIGAGHENITKDSYFEADQEPTTKQDEQTFELEVEGKSAQAEKKESPVSRNNVLIECNSNEEKPELTLEIIQNLLLSQEQSLEMANSSLVQDAENEEDEIVELEPPKKSPVPLVDLEQEDEGDAILFKCIDEKISELEKQF